MLGEYEVATVFQAIGVVGCMVYVGVYALLSWRVIGGDSLVFFAGNTVAAALVLASNFGTFSAPWVLLQILLIAATMTAMIALFFRETGRP